MKIQCVMSISDAASIVLVITWYRTTETEAQDGTSIFDLL